MHVATKDLPSAIQAALKSVQYHAKDVAIKTVSGPIDWSESAFGDGYRGYVTLVNLETGKFWTTFGSWGGPNMFETKAVDHDNGLREIPSNHVLIKGQSGAHISATVYARSDTLTPLLPAPVDVTDRERSILGTIYGLIPAASREHLSRAKPAVQESELDSLVSRGFLKRNKAGAISITTRGKNNAGRGFDR